MISFLHVLAFAVWLCAFFWLVRKRRRRPTSPARSWRPLTWILVTAGILVVATRQLLPGAAVVGLAILGAAAARIMRARTDRRLSALIPAATRTLAALCARCNNLREALVRLPSELRRYEESPAIQVFDRISERLFCKIPLPEALPIDQRNPDLQVLLLVLRAHDLRGGEIAPSLNRVAGAIEDLNNMRADIRSATEEGRVTLFVVCLLPILLVAGASQIVSRAAYLELLDSETGRQLTAIALVLYTAALALGTWLGEQDI